MDSRIGLDYIVENREYISKLGAALDTNNAVVKKQVFELLSALCAYNADGYSRAIETLEFYKNLKSERYRFKIVINELEKTANVEYQVALLAFVNCVIISASSLQDRIRIRNEFIGLKVLPLLSNLRKVAQSVGDIIVQLDVFDEQQECDEAQSLQGPSGINLGSHLDVFYAILRQVADTPQEVPFLSILQHLLRIDPKEPVSDVIWDTTEKLVHRATLLENHEDSTRLLRTSSVQKFACPHCRSDVTSPNRKASGAPASASMSNASSLQNNGPLSPTAQIPAYHVAAPPPPPPAPPSVVAPPPPPLPQKDNNAPPVPPPPIPAAPPAPPPPALNNLNISNTYPPRPITPECNNNVILLPQQDTPAPKSKMKTLNWGKIPPNKVIGKQNIWTIVANNHQESPMTDIDWNEMEGLFCLQSTSVQGSPKLGRDSSSSGYDTLDRKSKKENTEITLLDGKRSLNVNIFLKQFRSSNDDIIQLIRNGKHDEIGSEKLRGLLKILPEVDELDMLKSFNGDGNRLGNAEKFLLQLMGVPSYKLRIESMLLKEEFTAIVAYLEPCINAMLYAGDDLINNKMLREVLYMVVIAGNFLNSGGYAGNAAGVKLASLQKLTDIRANKPGMNLIHFVAMQAEKRDPDLLKFTMQLSALENASKTTSEQINNEINTLDMRIRKIKKQIEQPTTDGDIKAQMLEFLEAAQREVIALQAGMKEVDAMRLKLADFFCEDPTQFKLEECFKIFQTFCDKFKQAVNENMKRQQQEEQASLRRKQREEQLARRARQIAQCSTPVSDSENQFLDPTFDPRASPALFRRRMGSFNSGCEITNGFVRIEMADGLSPDITPNGSLRRRRSRVLAEEDELMEFLRTSGNEHISRDRKPYGSLDRSWARRARSGSSSRKRPELLNIDFGADRERASSPAPAAQLERQSSSTDPADGATVSAAQPEDAKPRISREWRQKIETWLQSNENDDKQNEEYKRKRRLLSNNRRSLENDAESERKLDTLPEEKIVPSTPTSTNKGTNNNNKGSNEANKYKRVYPDWKPSKTLEQTDVVGTIQAIADVNAAREKAHCRKNNQNSFENENGTTTVGGAIPSAAMTAGELREYSRQRSLENEEKQSIPLNSIAEERRRSYIQKLGERDATDRLHIYMRRPSVKDLGVVGAKAELQPAPCIETTASNTKVSASTVKSADSPDNSLKRPANYESSEYSKANDDTFTSLLDHHKSHNEKYSRKEIDADNVETPPVTRRHVNSNPSSTAAISSGTLTGSEGKSRDDSRIPQNGEFDQDAPGYFDRYSLARRTRRYKRPTDYSSGNEDFTVSKEPGEANNLRQSASANEVGHSPNRFAAPTKNENASSIDLTESITPISAAASKRTITKLEKVGRHISSINQEDVREAIRNLKSPTGTPERIWSPPRDIQSQQASLSKAPSAPTVIPAANGSTTLIKVTSHELNDEGFEETQSLVSDTPSQGKDSANSSCNETTEQLPQHSQSPKTQKSTVTKPTAAATASQKLSERLQVPKSRSTQPLKSQAACSQGSMKRISPIERTRSLRVPHGGAPAVQGSASSTAAAHMSHYTTNAMRRANSMRKPPHYNAVITQSLTASPSHSSSKRDVERSSSRNSLRSSRSSINSSASTNTVRRMPVVVAKTPLHTVSADSSPSKRPLSMQNTAHSRVLATVGNRGVGAGHAGVTTSRSSSSSSSVGANIVVMRKASSSGRPTTGSLSLGSPSFKENQTHPSGSRVNAARSAVLVKASLSTTSQPNVQRISSTRSSSATRAANSFMRPTASSTTKRNK